MAKAKTTDIKPAAHLAESAWSAAFDLAEEARIEIHKHLAALIALATDAVTSGGKFAGKVNDRASGFAGQALIASDRGVRKLVTASRDTALEAQKRATDTAKSIVGTRDAA